MTDGNPAPGVTPEQIQIAIQLEQVFNDRRVMMQQGPVLRARSAQRTNPPSDSSSK